MGPGRPRRRRRPRSGRVRRRPPSRSSAPTRSLPSFAVPDRLAALGPRAIRSCMAGRGVRRPPAISSAAGSASQPVRRSHRPHRRPDRRHVDDVADRAVNLCQDADYGSPPLPGPWPRPAADHAQAPQRDPVPPAARCPHRGSGPGPGWRLPAVTPPGRRRPRTGKLASSLSKGPRAMAPRTAVGLPGASSSNRRFAHLAPIKSEEMRHRRAARVDGVGQVDPPRRGIERPLSRARYRGRPALRSCQSARHYHAR
jgi:hypothetical protein